MEVVLGALPSLLPKLTLLLVEEYKLHKEVKVGIMFLQEELETMKAALEHISIIPAEQLPGQDRIWAKNVRELSYDIEDHIDTIMLKVKGSQATKKHSFKEFINKTLGSLMQPKIRRKIATDIRDMKSRVLEVHERRCRYEVNHSADKPVKVDTRALVRYEEAAKLVGIDEARDEVINILMEGNEVSNQHNKVVSIVGFGGLGKTTLANVVYEKLRAQFDCTAFVSVSQTPDMDKLFKDMFYQLTKYNTTSINAISVINELREFLRVKRYFIIIDDIWEISYWSDMIRYALPDGNDKYRIITTTRNITVAEQIGGAYKMKPLSIKHSKMLMYARIFGKEGNDKCFDKQLEEVSDKILKKCAGVPLAIITIASLLASKGKSKLEWYDVCNSVGAGLENNTLDNMRKVLLLSYYDMPSYLRSCLLYLSMFPEDYKINRDHLIWLWIAEGFIQSVEQEKNLFEMGETYFNELVNRCMIQPIYGKYSGMVESCGVHDMVLDLVRSLASEENFIVIQNNVCHSSTPKMARRLSLQNGKAGHGSPETSPNIKHVRSVIVFPPAIDHVPTLQHFKVLRVLDLADCDLSQSYNLEYLGNLVQLRYLGLTNACIDKLPEEIGKLQLLQTLEVQGNEICSLPWTIIFLTQLMCLHIDDDTRVPNGIGSLTALEELSSLDIHNHDDSADIIEELGHLMQLKVLKLVCLTKWNNVLDKSLVECLNKLHKIRSLQFLIRSGKCNLDGWVVVSPRHLRTLPLWGCWLSTLPAWMNPSLLLDLSVLVIGVRGLQQTDLEIFGKLPSLRYLDLTVDHEALGIHGRFTIGSCLFPCLLLCRLKGFGGPVVFKQGAMPRLEELRMEFPMQETKEINGGFDLGLGNLLSLQDVVIRFRCAGASKEKVEEAKVVLMHTIEVHPNHPTFRDYYVV